MWNTRKKLRRYEAACRGYEDRLLKIEHLHHSGEQLLSLMRRDLAKVEDINDALVRENKRLAEIVDADESMMDDLWIDYRKMMAHAAAFFRYHPISDFPPVLRDLALTVKEEVTCGEMMAEIGKTIDLKNYKYATGLMLMTAYACSIGGVMTPIGTPPNIIMIGFLQELAPQAPEISFFQWMIWGTVAMILYFIIASVVLWRLFPADVDHIKGAKEFIQKSVDSLGEWTRAQKNTMIAFSTAFVLWVAPSVLGIMYDVDSDVMKFYDSHFPEAIAAMIGGLMLFFLPVNVKTGEMTMTWKDGIEGIEWGTLLLFGGGLAMGSMMYDTGLSAWIGHGLKEALGNNPSEWLFVGVFCVAALIMSELTSHTASTNLMAPIAIGAALSLGFSPIPVAIGIALASSLGFMMPVSTPPNAIVYASGYVPITKMIKSGFIIDLIGIFLVTIPVLMLLVKYVMGVD